MSPTSPNHTPSIPELWLSPDAQVWDRALDGYWNLIKPQNLALERELDALALDDLRSLDAAGWYEFLHEKYFRWKYTAPNRLATTRAHLRFYLKENALDALDHIRVRLLAIDHTDIWISHRDRNRNQGLRNCRRLRVARAHVPLRIRHR